MQSQFQAKQQGTWPEVGFSISTDIMVVAGGGGASSNPSNGGGGGGGMILFPAVPTQFITSAIPITIGAGGTGGEANELSLIHISEPTRPY